ncbi:YcxB family protein [Streptomyces sp. NPDC015130]|uniref:YcxB family protein n=1 Tax=Streptomyces sp. NPDC015130 TaxID=3364940 RepID=UPI0036F8B1B8
MVMNAGRDGSQGDTVELEYRPTRADILTGVLVRERLRRLHVVRWGFTVLLGGAALLTIVAQGTLTVLTALVALCAALSWATPHLQARQVLRVVAGQGNHRTTVSESGSATETEHASLLQRWPVFRGYRETRDHVVLLGRDRSIQLVEVLPKRGLRSREDAERLLDLVGRHLPRV